MDSPTGTLYPCIDYANKHRAPKDIRHRQLYINGYDECIGFVPERFAQVMIWDELYFSVPPEPFPGSSFRAIVIKTDFLPALSKYNPKFSWHDDEKCCMLAFDKLAMDNCAQFPSLGAWAMTNYEQQEYSPVHVFDNRLGRIRIPTPLRGLIGALTVGVHLNVYSRNPTTGEYHIWVSHRAVGRDMSYSGMFDQIVAGGADPDDEIGCVLAPHKTLIREAKEEAGLEIDESTQHAYVPGNIKKPRSKIGKVARVSWITFYDEKDEDAGHLNEGQVEPGVRIIYDLEVKRDFRPTPNEPGIKFQLMNMSEVKKSLVGVYPRWKPNSGLVMLDFLVRHQQVTMNNDHQFSQIVNDLRPEIPFRFADQWRSRVKGW
ncbi:thiamine pyrophosphokinase [Fusarium longipes]|uniref:Thiamine pyrophosphokinase n=1 Tax=Fusarium longipes TaxID=694270 RepID=A0A395RZ37_9HYPO|nr:thiamine pyrophosphokinase [Fusarium longipes]